MMKMPNKRMIMRPSVVRYKYLTEEILKRSLLPLQHEHIYSDILHYYHQHHGTYMLGGSSEHVAQVCDGKLVFSPFCDCSRCNQMS